MEYSRQDVKSLIMQILYLDAIMGSIITNSVVKPDADHMEAARHVRETNDALYESVKFNDPEMFESLVEQASNNLLRSEFNDMVKNLDLGGQEGLT